MNLILEVEQGCRDELGQAEPETLLYTVKSLQNGSSPLYYVLEQKKIRPQYMVYEEHTRRKLPPEQDRPNCRVPG